MPTDQHQFSIASSFENVADLAERIGGVCATHPDADPDLADSMRLCMAEAMNNIVEHAYDGADGRMLYAHVTLEPGRCEVQLIDEGKPMPGGILPDGTVSFDEDEVETLPEGGFGWLLIRSQMDGIDYERREGCNVLRLEKRLGA